MKLPSLESVIDSAAETLKRFPLTLLLAAVGSFSFMVLIESNYEENNSVVINLAHTCLVGLSFMLSATLFSESKKWSFANGLYLQLGVLVALVGYYFYLPNTNDLDIEHVIRAILLGIAGHLLVAFVPFVKSNDLNGFWQYNKELFLSFLVAVLYSGVLYLGLSLAILAVDQLFDVGIDGEIYGHLFVVLAGIFNTWFFLSEVPKNIEELENERTYPTGLKIFTQYVLIPLVTIYLIILYFYGIKILVQWELPLGWVSYLVIGFSVTGIFSLLMVYPIQNSEENLWIRTYTKWFYFALFPLIVLLFVAIGRRVFDYGITENRYFILVLAFWLLGISIYLLINKQKNIKIIPLSLFFVAALSHFGPWGTFSVSRNSQLARLENYLENSNILVDGNIVNNSTAVIDSVSTVEINNIVSYIIEYHGYSCLQPYTNLNLDSLENLPDTVYVYMKDEIIKAYGLDIYSYDSDNYFNLSGNFGEAISLNNFDYIADINYYNYYEDSVENSIFLNDSAYINYKLNSKNNFVVSYQGSVLEIIWADYFSELAKRNVQYYTVPPDSMTFNAENELIKLQVLVTSISGEKDSTNVYRFNNLYGKILFSPKNQAVIIEEE